MFRAQRITKHFLTTSGLVLGNHAYGQLEILDDNYLSSIEGQAFISVENDIHSNGSIKYTRANLGLSGKIQLNADQVMLGRYNRTGEVNGSADIDISNFSLGHIDGSGNIIPFEFEDPYLEVAYKNYTAVGIRLGFRKAKGSFSGDLNKITGYIPVRIEGPAKPVRDAAGSWNRGLLTLAGINDSTILGANAELVSFYGYGHSSSGSSDQIRATHTGIKDGNIIGLVSGGGLGGLSGSLLSLFKSSNCELQGIATCFSLSSYKTLPLGNFHRNQNNGESDGAYLAQADPATGFFVSLSTEPLAWRNLENNAFVNVQQGAFMYLPKTGGQSSVKVDFGGALNGIPRKDTCFSSATQGC